MIGTSSSPQQTSCIQKFACLITIVLASLGSVLLSKGQEITAENALDLLVEEQIRRGGKPKELAAQLGPQLDLADLDVLLRPEPGDFRRLKAHTYLLEHHPASDKEKGDLVATRLREADDSTTVGLLMLVARREQIGASLGGVNLVL